MQKLKQPANRQNKPTNNTTTLKHFLDSYEAVTLQSALATFEDSLGWELMKSYSFFIQRTYEVAALDKVSKKDELQSAAYAAGYAKACEDLQTFSDGLRQTILGSTQIIENPRPEE